MKTYHFTFILLLLLTTHFVQAQKPTTQFNGYGYLEYELDFSGGPTSYFYLGEHDFFVNSKLNDKISFLGEYVIRFNGSSSTSFLPSIERSLVKYNYYKNHNIIMGNAQHVEQQAGGDSCSEPDGRQRQRNPQARVVQQPPPGGCECQHQRCANTQRNRRPYPVGQQCHVQQRARRHQSRYPEAPGGFLHAKAQPDRRHGARQRAVRRYQF